MARYKKYAVYRCHKCGEKWHVAMFETPGNLYCPPEIRCEPEEDTEKCPECGSTDVYFDDVVIE